MADSPWVANCLRIATDKAGRDLTPEEAEAVRVKARAEVEGKEVDATGQWSKGLPTYKPLTTTGRKTHRDTNPANGEQQDHHAHAPTEAQDGLVPAHSNEAHYLPGRWRKHPQGLSRGLVGLGLGPTALLVYLAMWERAGRRNDGFEPGVLTATYPELAEALGVTRKKVARATERLIEKGLVKRLGRGRLLVLMPLEGGTP